jgi:heat shock protein HslJ
MNTMIRKTFFFLAVLIATIFVGAVTTTFAQSPSRVTDRQVSSLLAQLERDTDIFSRGLIAAIDRSRLNGTRSEDEITEYVRDFEEATDRLKNRFDSRSAVSADVEEVLTRAANIDRFLQQNRLTTRVQTDFNQVKTDLNTLARYYNVRWNWNQTTRMGTGMGTDTRTGTGYGTTNRFTGTYRLDASRSTDVQSEIDRALSGVDANRLDRIRRQAMRRLEAPQELAIERIGRNVTIASTNSPRVTFEANGRAQTETMPNGRSMSTTATLTGEQLVLDYTGDRANDFYVAFNPTRGGNELRVTRRIYLEGINRQVTTESVYTRIDTMAQFDRVYTGGTSAGNGGYNNNDGGYNNNNTTPNGQFIIPNGTRLVAVLNTDLDTKLAQEGDRFTMEVSSPSQYRGAIIEGRLTGVQRSGRVSGRAQVGLDFETIRLRNGQAYEFAGLIDSVRDANGDTVSINNEGVVRDGSQTTRTVTRAGIGAALGALIGAIAGGGQGAAIGAGVGAGAGAGSVILQGRDDLNLKAGTEITISASAPASVSNR